MQRRQEQSEIRRGFSGVISYVCAVGQFKDRASLGRLEVIARHVTARLLQVLHLKNHKKHANIRSMTAPFNVKFGSLPPRLPMRRVIINKDLCEVEAWRKLREVFDLFLEGRGEVLSPQFELKCGVFQSKAFENRHCARHTASHLQHLPAQIHASST